jgi:hypothetical protein
MCKQHCLSSSFLVSALDLIQLTPPSAHTITLKPKPCPTPPLSPTTIDTWTACEREPVLATVAQALVSAHGLAPPIRILKKLSSQLTHSGHGTDVPIPAALVLHEIFGTDALSEQLLPALRDLQASGVVRRGARFLPRGVRVVAALADAGSAAARALRLPVGCHDVAAAAAAAGLATPPNLDALLPLAPRRSELQLDELGDGLLLLTEPVPVLSFDFEDCSQWPLPLNGSVLATLPALLRPLSMTDWLTKTTTKTTMTMAASGATAGAAAAAADVAGAAGEAVIAAARAHRLCCVSWWEADCGAGGWLSTRPGKTALGHWQQSLEWLTPSAPALLDAGSRPIVLRVSWSVDRVRFALSEG